METLYRIEPTRLASPAEPIQNLIADIVEAAVRLESRIHPDTAASLADLVRIMNCYYSNLIEGHSTQPRDIERALASDLVAEDKRRRNLQLEALAHVRVQAKIDSLYREGQLPEPASVSFIKWLHLEFYRDAPEEFLRVGEGQHGFIMEPGVFRQRPEHDNVVGRHVPPSSSTVDEFMAGFEQRFRLTGMGKAERLLVLAIAHHRLNYIHPFPDGNGRVSRLMSHAMGLVGGIGAYGLWSVSRGLAHGLGDRSQYKRMMDLADTPRQGDLDGRGNLSTSALAEYVEWFLRVCLDQLNFMRSLFALDELVGRLHAFASRRQLRPEAAAILEHVAVRGHMARGEAARVTGLQERTARSVLTSLLELGILGSSSPKGAVTLHFQTTIAAEMFPGLFLE